VLVINNFYQRLSGGRVLYSFTAKFKKKAEKNLDSIMKPINYRKGRMLKGRSK
jgi:hypothetical protein